MAFHVYTVSLTSINTITSADYVYDVYNVILKVPFVNKQAFKQLTNRTS